MDIREITSKREWGAIADRLRAPLSQQWIYGDVAKRLGRSVRRVALFDDANPVVAAQFLSRRALGIPINACIGGPLVDPSYDINLRRRPFTSHFPTIAVSHAALGGIPLGGTTVTCEWDISSDQDVLRARMAPKWRRALDRSLRLGRSPICDRLSREHLDRLIAKERAQQSQRGYKGLPPEFALLLKEVDGDCLRLFQTLDGAMLFVVHGNSATYLIGHAGEKSRRIDAHRRILWHAASELKNQGIHRIDLGTIDMRRAPGLAKFKTGTGASTKPLRPWLWI